MEKTGNDSWDRQLGYCQSSGWCSRHDPSIIANTGWMDFQCECHEARVKWHVILMSKVSYRIDLFIVTTIFWGLRVNRGFFFCHNYSNPLEAYCCCSMIVANIYFFIIILTWFPFQILHIVNEKVSPLNHLCLLLAFRIKRNPINLSWNSSADIGIWDHCVTLQINHQGNITWLILFRK